VLTDNLKSTHRTFSGFRFLERLEQSKAVKRLERFEPNLGWFARGIDFSLEGPFQVQKVSQSTPTTA
jgi:hypothetical protein